MDRTRIRWSNLGRLVGGLSAGGLLLFVVPGLVEAPEPPPLASDVGLTSGATGAFADADSARKPVRRRHPQAREGEPGRTFAGRSRAHRQEPEREPEHGAAGTPPDRQPEPPVVNPAPPVAPSPPPSPVALPAPPAAPEPPAAAPSEPDPPAPDPPEPETHPPPAPDPPPPPPAGPSQFGFEH